ncbi:PIN domain-containing protein [Dyadobacter sp. CY345]|uniref:type II toxin-antitoxin system VapC family toxin n=1 Tax=Dyadobacter sp. CY345 TaxID=2909335 RepID=UPI001F169445|nr:PIN domain-containing protein [Dyadobacter sp. CY345]MCF2447512.1 PIN domain-containing protein [Dyadobacter sp. CY345]
MNLFIDSDILLDAVLQRLPYFDSAMQLLSFADRDGYTLYCSAHSILNVYYVTRKIAGKVAATKSANLLQENLSIADTNRNALRAGLSSDFVDFEDAVQYAIAIENKCSIIITRNLKDYNKSSIPAMTAEQYLTSIR